MKILKLGNEISLTSLDFMSQGIQNQSWINLFICIKCLYIIIQIYIPGFNLRRGRSLSFTGKKNKKSPTSDETTSSLSGTSSSVGVIGKSPKWPLKFNCSKKDLKATLPTQDEKNCCKCTCYKKKDENINEERNEPISPTGTLASLENSGNYLRCSSTWSKNNKKINHKLTRFEYHHSSSAQAQKWIIIYMHSIYDHISHIFLKILSNIVIHDNSLHLRS